MRPTTTTRRRRRRRGDDDGEAVARVRAKGEAGREEGLVDHLYERRDLGDGHPRWACGEQFLRVELPVRHGDGCDHEEGLRDRAGVGVRRGAA